MRVVFCIAVGFRGENGVLDAAGERGVPCGHGSNCVFLSVAIRLGDSIRVVCLVARRL